MSDMRNTTRYTTSSIEQILDEVAERLPEMLEQLEQMAWEYRLSRVEVVERDYYGRQNKTFKEHQPLWDEEVLKYYRNGGDGTRIDWVIGSASYGSGDETSVDGGRRGWRAEHRLKVKLPKPLKETALDQLARLQPDGTMGVRQDRQLAADLAASLLYRWVQRLSHYTKEVLSLNNVRDQVNDLVNRLATEIGDAYPLAIGACQKRARSTKAEVIRNANYYYLRHDEKGPLHRAMYKVRRQYRLISAGKAFWQAKLVKHGVSDVPPIMKLSQVLRSMAEELESRGE